MSWLDFFNLSQPAFDWIQVEVTSHCNAACLYCPHTVYRHRWAGRHLSLQTFKKLIPAFSRTGLVYLQGWGEPFLNPDFFTMAALAREAGCRVGVTTNGTLLDGDKISRLVELELDVVAFSLAGTDPAQDEVRRGTHLQQVLEAISRLQEEKGRRGRQKPQINLAYMLLRSGLEALSRLPQLLKDLEIGQVVISTLDFVPSGSLKTETIQPRTVPEHLGLEALVRDVTAAGKARGLEIHFPFPPAGQPGRVCRDNVQQALVVAADGGVSPCTLTNLPVSGVTHVLRGKERPYRPLTFGNVNRHPLRITWSQPEYSRFRHSFYDKVLPDCCRDCPKLY